MELAPATLLLHCILQFVSWEALHGRYVPVALVPVEVRDRYFGEVDRKEFFDDVPVLDISFGLSNTLQYGGLVLCLTALCFEHSFNSELALSKFLYQNSILIQVLIGLRFLRFTGFFVGNGLDQGSKVEHLTLDPVSDVLEWVLKLLW